MLHLIILTADSGSEAPAEMYIDYQSESIGFTVITKKDKEQYDFSIEKEDWETFKNFIETQMRNDKQDDSK